MTGRCRRDRPRDAGTLSVELVIIIPMLLLLLGLVYAYGRVSQVNGTMDAGVRDAARAATQARDGASAQQLATQVIQESVKASTASCLNSLKVTLTPLEAGVPLTVTGSCRYTLDDLGLPGFPGTINVSSSFTSPVDQFRRVGP